MSLPRNVNLLETVIEELEADKEKTKSSDKNTLKSTKSAKGNKKKTGGKTKKAKRDETQKEKQLEETDKKLIVEVPMAEKGKTLNTIQEVKTKSEMVGDATREHILDSKETDPNPSDSSKQACGTDSDLSITENMSSGKTQDEGQSAENRLFTRVFSLRNKEKHLSKKDILITPNANMEKGTHWSGNANDKENSLSYNAHTHSQEFIRSNSDKSILTAISEPGGNKPFKVYTKRRRPMSTSALSKKVLEAYLPRKSFFSSHDKVLREAGFQVDNVMKSKKRPNWRLILRMHTEEELNPDFGKEPEKPVFTEPQIKDESDDDSEEVPLHVMDAVDTLMSQDKDGQPSKRKLRLAAKKLALEEKCDYRPLLDYLRYISDHPEEYMNMARYSSKDIDYKHPSVMVRMARVFRKAHHGTARNNIFTHALANLKPKILETATQQRHGRSELGRNEFGATKKDQSEGPQEQSGASQEEGKTEIEKFKLKTEKWMGSLTTLQILKAKELALKDMGEEDITVTKWWLAFKTCNYLRIPPTVLEQAQ